MRLTGNTILITGGTSGIGRGLAEALHARGNRVIVAGRRQELLDEIAAANPGIVGMPVDLDDSAAIAAFAAEVRDRFPALNVLANNAGISRPEDLASDDWETSVAEAILRTNVVSVLALTSALLPHLKSRPEATIVATTSGLAFLPSAGYPTYCASKAFLHSWIESLRSALKHTSVEVLELIPPYVRTELSGVFQATDPRTQPLDEYIAEVIAILERGDLPRGEILAERAKELRLAERRGDYEATYANYNDR